MVAEKARLKKKTFPIIDTHMHYGTDPAVAQYTCVPYMHYGNPKSVIRCLDEQGAKYGVLFPHDRPMNPPLDTTYEHANAKVAEAQQQFPNRIIAVARINPLFGRKATQIHLDRCAGEWGFKGVKLVASYDQYHASDINVLAPVMEKAEEYDLTVLFHSGDSHKDMPALQSFTARHFPKVRIVLAHIGGHTGLREAINACQENPNIYCDMAQAWPYDIKAFVRTVGIERLTYGSDVPYQSPEVEQLKLRVIELSQEEEEKVFFENAKQIWRISEL
jgi:predicted TIM-barrel fold metal-dependent hydrolase